VLRNGLIDRSIVKRSAGPEATLAAG
jgi:hypothetical protein